MPFATAAFLSLDIHRLFLPFNLSFCAYTDNSKCRGLVELPPGDYDILSVELQVDANPCEATFYICDTDVSVCDVNSCDYNRLNATYATLATGVAGWQPDCPNYASSRPFQDAWALGENSFTLSSPTNITCLPQNCKLRLMTERNTSRTKLRSSAGTNARFVRIANCSLGQPTRDTAPTVGSR